VFVCHLSVYRSMCSIFKDRLENEVYVGLRLSEMLPVFEGGPVYFFFFFFNEVRDAASNSAYYGYPKLWILRYPAHRYHAVRMT
jgi:hypothetical protein